jgi:ribosome-associated translation inhibitor RaiA
MNQIDKVEKAITRIEIKLNSTELRLDNIEKGPFTNIDTNLARIDKTLTESLTNEIQNSEHKRIQLTSSNQQMVTAFNSTNDSLSKFMIN